MPQEIKPNPEDREMNWWERYQLASAIQQIGKAIGSHTVREAMYEVPRAINTLTEFTALVRPRPELTEREANLSSNLHTYTRKYMDGPLSCILYRLIAESRGMRIWYAFLKSLVGQDWTKDKRLKMNVQTAIAAADRAYDEEETTDNLLMYQTLKLWAEDGCVEIVREVITEWMREDEKEVFDDTNRYAVRHSETKLFYGGGPEAHVKKKRAARYSLEAARDIVSRMPEWEVINLETNETVLLDKNPSN